MVSFIQLLLLWTRFFEIIKFHKTLDSWSSLKNLTSVNFEREVENLIFHHINCEYIDLYIAAERLVISALFNQEISYHIYCLLLFRKRKFVKNLLFLSIISPTSIFPLSFLVLSQKMEPGKTLGSLMLSMILRKSKATCYHQLRRK